MGKGLVILICIIGGILLFGFLWFQLLDQPSNMDTAQPMKLSEPAQEPTTTQSMAEEKSVPVVEMPLPTPSTEESLPAAANVNKKNFESDEDVADTRDTVSIEVEPDDE